MLSRLATSRTGRRVPSVIAIPPTRCLTTSARILQTTTAPTVGRCVRLDRDARAAFGDLSEALDLMEIAGDQLPNRYQDRLAELHSEVDDLAAEVWNQEVEDDE